MSEKAIPKTTFSTMNGKFEFTRLPFRKYKNGTHGKSGNNLPTTTKSEFKSKFREI
jgi:hypothetical protein